MACPVIQRTFVLGNSLHHALLARAMNEAKRNKQNYLDAKAAFNARDLDACLAFYASQHRIMRRTQTSEAQSIRQFFEATLATWPDIALRVENVVADGEWVMGRSVAVATHSTTVMGASPTHKVVETAFWDLHRFDSDGLIVQTWNLMDVPTLMSQLTASGLK